MAIFDEPCRAYFDFAVATAARERADVSQCSERGYRTALANARTVMQDPKTFAIRGNWKVSPTLQRSQPQAAAGNLLDFIVEVSDRDVSGRWHDVLNEEQDPSADAVADRIRLEGHHARTLRSGHIHVEQVGCPRQRLGDDPAGMKGGSIGRLELDPIFADQVTATPQHLLRGRGDVQ